jgi:4-amino-4-deoxy-L-arabinose transferase-like glycosyltransferase
MLSALMEKPANIFLFIVVLTVLRFVAGAVLPLSADEAYYWLWSKHLAAGYYDHPPAIAYLIRGGTALFGDAPIGVRFLPLLSSIAASWFVWRSGAILLRGEAAGGLCCLLFNLTLMIAVETMAATPDAPAIACAAAFLFALVKLDETEDGRWFLALGAAGGLSLLSKYTGFFLGVGALAWLVWEPRARRWFLSPWLYAGAVIAFGLFLPNLWWNATHGWMTFAFQFGRIGAGHFTGRFLAEFLGAQLVLASPFIFVLIVLGLPRSPSVIVVAVLPSILYFALHSLHDRVQGNWPCFLYPFLAVASVVAMREVWRGWQEWFRKWSALLAVPVAFVLLATCYAQAIFGLIPLGRQDPFARLLGVGFSNVARDIGEEQVASSAAAIVTTDYATTAWFAYYTRLPVIQLNEEDRWPSAPRAPVALLRQPLLYVTETNRDRHEFVATHFGTVSQPSMLTRERNGVPVGRYQVYRLNDFHGPALGREPEAQP